LFQFSKKFILIMNTYVIEKSYTIATVYLIQLTSNGRVIPLIEVISKWQYSTTQALSETGEYCKNILPRK